MEVHFGAVGWGRLNSYESRCIYRAESTLHKSPGCIHVHYLPGRGRWRRIGIREPYIDHQILELDAVIEASTTIEQERSMDGSYVRIIQRIRGPGTGRR